MEQSLSIKNLRSFFLFPLLLRQKLGTFNARKNQPFEQLSYADALFNTLPFVIEEFDGMILV